MKNEFDLDRLMREESRHDVKNLLYENMKKVAEMQDGLSEIDKAYMAGRIDGMIDARLLAGRTA